MSKLLSDKVKKIPPTEVSADRYEFLKLGEAEPDLGVPDISGQILTSTTAGVRSWTNTSALVGYTGSQGLGFTPLVGGRPWATDGSLIGTNINWNVPEPPGMGAFAIGNYILLSDTTSGSTYYYYARITLIQFAGGFGWAVHADILGDGGIPVGGESSSWITELTGEQGITGFTGSQGIQGPAGTGGIGGAAGYTGSQGIQGVTGFTGSVGFTGSQGIQGVTGFTGSVGFVGSKGDQGDLGYTGSQGSPDTANDILTKIKTVDGTGSGLDADLLDGINSGSFLRSDTNTAMSTGYLTLANDPTTALHAATKQYVDSAVNEVLSLTKTLTLSTDWQNVGISNTDLATGSYFVQLYANDVSSGGTNNNEYYSGVMSWYSGTTGSSLDLPTDEIVLHRAGGSGDGALYLRTIRTTGASNLNLQIYSNTPNASSANYVFKFKRMI